MPSFAVLNGPNLNLLGQREPATYGRTTLAEIGKSCATVASELDCELSWFQSNHEGALVDEIQRLASDGTDGLVVNAGAYTHTSIAIRDALSTLDAPFVEVHISNVHAREGFRAHSYLSDIAAGVIVGCGVQGYELAVRRLSALAGQHG
ncbi:type II 3-dehydroquinate dehydratase [Luteipulveratus flavus]|uniref:3-dehydroquinate dehydratase n=1 Tax=Luteipulveratus flavus TaxID=3031728 RepID=A0ABT6C2D4_9MICO|nr:type II 3-dehydroquinate dehydratase [Luteipulveratus sp. YIM 133296]MDF8262791.1 type II 3-dehydroquinate dehydratase [Luteipulveratus sp. YIM 133296]